MSEGFPPIMAIWDGQAFAPSHPRWAAKADQALVVGQEYYIGEHHDRSHKTHNHYFACVTQAWRNLPECHAQAPYATSPDHLRKYALIQTGYSDSASFTCGSHEEAKRFAAFLRPIDDFAVVTVSNSVVTRFTAQSQSMKAMGKKVFQQSKEEVLDYLSSLMGASLAELSQNSRSAA